MINAINTYKPNTLQQPPVYNNPSLNNKSSADTVVSQPVIYNYVKTAPAKASLFYINDIHGNIGNMARVYTAKQAVDRYVKSDANLKNADYMSYSSGDIQIGVDDHLNKCANVFLNSVGVKAAALGNHEFDYEPAKLAEMVKDKNFKILGLNLKIQDGNPLNQYIEKTYVQEINGNKYGVIGLSPSDLHERIRGNASREQVQVDSIDNTIREVQAAADKFREQGINKVIVISHIGLSNDQKLAKETTGVDVILGGHTHEILPSVKDGINLLYSKSGEPVVITQAGKNGENVGLLNLEFDEKGLITKAQNNVIRTNKFKRNIPLRTVFNLILGKPEQLGVISNAAPPPEHRLIDPNPHMYLIMDAVRKEMGTDMALINAGNARGHFEAGPVDSRQVFEVVPIKNDLVLMKLTEKEIVDALKNGAKSFVNPGNKPSIVIPSGLKYTVTKGGVVKAATFIDKTGKEIPIDVNNPNPNKVYTVATDDFFASGGDHLIADKISTNEIDKRFDYDKDKVACEYIKKIGHPFDVVDDGRINVID